MAKKAEKIIEEIFEGKKDVKSIIPLIAKLMGTSYDIATAAAKKIIDHKLTDTKKVSMYKLNILYNQSASQFLSFAKEFLLKNKNIDDVPDEEEQKMIDWKQKAIEMQKQKDEFESKYESI